MDLTALERQIREQIVMSHSVGGVLDRDRLVQAVDLEFDQLTRDVRKSLGDGDKELIRQRLCDEFLGFGPVQALLEDDSVTEIMIAAPDMIYIERNGRKEISAKRFHDAGHIRSVVERMMEKSGRRLDETMPYADFALPDGSRVNVIIPPLACGCAQVTIRKFLDTIGNADDLVRFGTLDERMARFLETCMRVKKNLLFSGATGCGKTTTLAALSSYIDPQERVVTIEDTLELDLNQQHVVPLLTRPPNIEGTGEVTLRDQVASGLDIVIQQEQFSDGTRKITHISEIGGMDGDRVRIQDLFRYELESTGADGGVQGRFVGVSAPSDLEDYRRRGYPLSDSLFA
jgi:pilus assembly protein CpaF